MAGAKFKYMSLYEALKKGFYDGTYRIGSLFPTEDELSSQYNVSKTTIRKANQTSGAGRVHRCPAGKRHLCQVTGPDRDRCQVWFTPWHVAAF